MRNLNELAKDVHADNLRNGWGVNLNTGEPVERNKGQLLMLMVSELAEAVEGERKDLMDDKLTHRPMAEVEMADVAIRAFDYAGSFGHRLGIISPIPIPSSSNRAEALIRITKLVVDIYTMETCHEKAGASRKLSQLICSCIRYCDAFGYDFWGAFDEKREFNRNRVDHTLEARRAAGGKKW